MQIGGWQRALGALCVVVVCTSCAKPRTLSQDGGAVRRTGSPHGVESCQDVRIVVADGGFPLAFGWDEGEHPFGKPEPLLVCVGGGMRVSVAADPGITVTPGELPATGQKAALRFQVTVQPGTTGGITYTQKFADGGVMHTARVLNVTPSGNGWRFVNPDPPSVPVKHLRHSKTAIRIDPSPSR